MLKNRMIMESTSNTSRMYGIEKAHDYIFVLDAHKNVVNFYADCDMIDTHYLRVDKMIKLLSSTITDKKILLSTYFNMSEYYGYDRFKKVISEM